MNRKNIFLINLCIAVISIIFTAGVINMVYENRIRDVKEQYFRFTAEILATRIKTGVDFGMDIDNYYGMSSIVSKAESYDEDNMDAIFINTMGEPVEYTFKGSKNEVEKLSYILSEEMKEHLNGEENIAESGDNVFIIQPIEVDNKYAYLVILYNKDIFSLKESWNVFKEYRKNVDSIVLSTMDSIKDSIYDLHNKGVKGSDIEELRDFYNGKFKDFGLVSSIELGYDMPQTNDYSLSRSIFKDDNGEFTATLNIDKQYINNTYMQTLFTFLASLIVSVIIIIEIGSINKIVGNAADIKSEYRDKSFKGTMSGIIKFFTFFSYLAVYAVLPYGAVIIRQGGETILGMPVSLASSLPVSLNCVGIFIMVIFGNLILKKTGIRAYIFITVLSGIAAMLMCYLNLSIYTVIPSSFLLGLCLGMEKTIMNYFISVCSDSDSEIKINFGYYNGGLLTGLALGGSIGGIISSARGYEYTYLAGAVIMLFMFVTINLLIPIRIIKSRTQNHLSDNNEKTASFAGFIKELVKRPRLALDFASACIPLNIGLMFIVSFLPVLLALNDLSSLVNTFSYILYGIAGNYIGIFLIKKLKGLRENISGFISLMFLSLSVLVLIPKVSIITILISATLAGLFDGYGGASLTVIPVNCKNAEGIDKSLLLTGTSVMASIVCIVSPMVYSCILSPGSITTNLIIVFMFFVLSAIYILKIKSV